MSYVTTYNELMNGMNNLYYRTSAPHFRSHMTTYVELINGMNYLYYRALALHYEETVWQIEKINELLIL